MKQASPRRGSCRYHLAMARLLSLLPVLAFGLLTLSLAPPARGEGGPGGGESPRLVIDREEHSFGAAAQEQELETTFRIKNVGTARAEGIQPVGDCGCYRVTIDRPSMAGELNRITAPTLVLVGEHDVHYLEEAELMAKRIVEAERVVVSGVGHAMSAEAPERFGDEVLRFLGAPDLPRP